MIADEEPKPIINLNDYVTAPVDCKSMKIISSKAVKQNLRRVYQDLTIDDAV